MTAGLVLGLAALLAGGLVGGRRGPKAWRERAFSMLPARDPNAPKEVTSFKEIDDTLDGLRCACQGPMIRIGEGPASHALGGSPKLSPSIHRVLTECRYCGRRAPLYFDISKIPQ